MGCSISRPGDDDVVEKFHARKRFMKKAVLQRQHFAMAHCAYLHTLRNTGSALRQFAEGEGVKDVADSTPRRALELEPPPFPLHLLPASPNRNSPHVEIKGQAHAERSESIMDGASPIERERLSTWTPDSSPDKDNDTPPPPSPPKSTWDIFNPFRPSSPPLNLQESRHRRRDRGSSQERHKNRSSTYGMPYNDDQSAAVIPRLENDFDATINSSSVLSKWERSNRDFGTMVNAGAAGGERELVVMVKELDDRFLKASACGNAVSKVLETRKGHFSTTELPRESRRVPPHAQASGMLSSLYSWVPRNPLMASNDDHLTSVAESELMGSHALTLERLRAWEKKLFDEVKAGEDLRNKHHKKCTLLRQQEDKGEERSSIDKTRAAVKHYHSLILVSIQGIESTSVAVKKMRDEELYPQLLELSHGLMYMWRTMHECHAQQKLLVLQFKNLDSWVAQEATSDYHHHATVELEKELSTWHDCFCKLVSSQREYMTALNGWARLSVLHVDAHFDSPNKENVHLNSNEDHLDSTSSPAPKPPTPLAVALCEEWQKALDRLPDKVASEAIKSFVAVVHALVTQQSDELKQKKRVERLSKKLEKKILDLHNAEKKQVEAAVRTPPPIAHPSISKKSTDVDDDEYYNYNEHDNESMSTDSSERVSEDLSSSVTTPRDPLMERKTAVDLLKKKVEDERVKHGKCVKGTRVLTMNSLQTGLPGVFEAMTGFSAVCAQAFQALYNNATGHMVED